MHKDFTSAIGIRAIAIFEMVKGLLGFAVGIALISLLHKDLESVAGNVLDYLHIDPTGHFAQIFVERASKINESNIILFVVLAFVYTIVRMIEAYGLWRLRAWAEWFAIISGCIYLPFEVYEIFRKPDILHFVIFFGNVLLVLYLIYVRGESRYHQTHPDEPVVEVFKK
ncbi:MAG: DUF2127 domain-containing protein [Pyrinomonadaceae bacterium]